MTDRRTLLTNLVLRGSVVTTAARAVALAAAADRLLHLAKKADRSEGSEQLRLRRQLLRRLDHPLAAKRLMTELVARLERPTVRREKIGFRAGDNAPLIRISLAEPPPRSHVERLPADR